MKKLLRNLTLAALVAAPAFNASAELTLTENWFGKSTTIGNSWNGATDPGINARFITGKDGKAYTIDMAKKAIVSFQGTAGSETLSEPTVVKELALPEGVTLLGTSLSIDSKGNFIFNYNFTQASSAQYWGVYNPATDVVTDYTIPAEECVVQRIDHMGRVVGDATSTEGAYGYAFGATAKYPLVYHFTGDGTKTTKITCAPLDGVAIDGVEANANSWAQPAFSTAAEIATAPTDSYFGTLNVTQVFSMVGGTMTTYGETTDVYNGKFIGNTSGQGGFDTFTIAGKRYFVRNFEASWKPYTAKSVIYNFAIFDEDGVQVATCQKGDWIPGSAMSAEKPAPSQYGSSTLVAEQVDENKVNIYAYVTGGAAKNPACDGCWCGFYTFTDTDLIPAEPVLSGSGTVDDPYIIATAEDLCNAHLVIPQEEAGDVVYFKQTADIDMKGITDWQALNGWYGSYAGQFCYDGDYHVIRNFAPVDGVEIDDKSLMGTPEFGHYYDTSIFGVLRGTVKNLGVIDATIEEKNKFDGAGIISCYSGQGGVEATIENVFVIGKVKGLKRVGGMLAHAGANNTIKNAYAVVELEGPAGLTAGIIGSTNNKEITIEGGYVYVTDVEGSTAALIAAGSGTVVIPELSFDAYGKGNLFAADITCTTKDGIWFDDTVDVKNLQQFQKSLFGDKKMLGGYPTFNWVTEDQINGPAPEVEPDGTEANPYIIATAEDLCNAWTKIQPETVTYFKQTADIDMKGITDWHAVNGFNGGYLVGEERIYSSAIVYDGQNHIISNFAPASQPAVEPEHNNYYYCSSVFGVLAGTVKNLGIVDANVVNNDQGAAILAVYGGHSSAPAGFQAATIDNVFVTGKAESATYVGGMIGTTGNAVNITNSYAIVDVKGGVETAGLVSRATQPVTLNNVYVAGTVNNGALVVKQREGKAASVNATNVVALNTGSDVLTNVTGDALVGTIVPGTLAELKGDIQGWTAFNEGNEYAGYPALNGFDLSAYAVQDGTSEATAYEIATAEDLANAWTKIQPATVTYFKQTADIDMKDVTDWHAVNGFNGGYLVGEERVYSSAIVYDGQNHLITNFAPASQPAVEPEHNNYYYCSSVFGVLAGTVKNLGIVDANVVNNDQGAAILAVYGGHSSAPAGFQAATIDNVFVTGKAESATYVGGMIGTTGSAVNITNSYAIVDVKGGVETAGLVSRATQPVTLKNVYVAGTVNNGALVVKQREGKAASVNATDVVALNTGSDVLTNVTGDALVGTIVPGTLAELKADIQGWAAFNEKKEAKGYPTLNWMSAEQIELAGVEEVIADQLGEDANAPVEYFNLQGVRVENPSTGLYIKRQGKTVTKVIIR